MHMHMQAQTETPSNNVSTCQTISLTHTRIHIHTHAYTHIYTYTHMCTTCSECVTDVYVGVKTHLCNVHTSPCTSVQNTCSKVHTTPTAGRVHTRPCIYAYTCMHVHMGAYARPRHHPTRQGVSTSPSTHTCAHACACIRVRMYAYTGAHIYVKRVLKDFR